MKIRNYPSKQSVPGWMFKTLAFTFLFMVSLGSYAQTVSGVVLDEDGLSVIGANVVVPGTTVGTITDVDGSFSLNVGDATEIAVSYLGFTTQTIQLDGRSSYNISLASNSELLDEVVVIGYGTQKKSDLTGAVASLKGAEIAAIVTGNPTSALQGRMPGIQVESFGGQPGGATNVFVRGIGSLTNSFPLYVIDGTYAENMNFVNPNDIQSIEVLKDASSAAIYGSRASNGVVLITTKSGNNDGDVSVNLSVKAGVETATKKLDFLNSREFLDYRADVEANDATGFVIDESNFMENGQLIDTDWQEESFGTGSLMDYGLSVSGGDENAKYFVSTNIYDQGGILIGSGFKRLNFRANSQFKLGKLTISESLGLSQTQTQENEYFGFEAATAPILRLNNPDNLGGFEAPERATAGFGGLNNFALASLEDNLDTRRNLIGNLSAAYEIIDGLTAKVSVGAEYVNGFDRTFRPQYFMSTTDARFNDNQQNDLTHVRSEFLRTQVEPTLSYNRDSGVHSYGVVVGASRIKTDFSLLGTYVGNLPSDQISTVGAAGTENILGSAGFSEVDALISTFGRLNYAYNNKYLFSATVRRDASSKFAEGFRSDIFPSFSAGWRVSSEDFFPADGFLTFLKLRAGYGELGAQNVGNYLYQSTFGTTSSSSFGNGIVPGFAQTAFANESLQWETSKTINVGADFELMDGKFAGSLEYYKKDIQNLLVAVPIPSSNGTSVPVTQNTGALDNSGVEFQISYRNNANKFKYNVGFNLGTQSSVLSSVPSEFFGPSVNEGLQSVNIFREGEAPGAFYGFNVTDVYDDQAQIDSDPNRANDPGIGALSPGDFVKEDIAGPLDDNGNPTGPDGIVDNNDLQILGSPVPDFTYGFNFNGTYGKLDFGMLFNGVYGNEIYNQARAFNTFFADGNKLTDVLDRWTPTNTTGTLPRAVGSTDTGNNAAPSSFFVEDGSYLRLKNLNIGYDLSDVINVTGIEAIRVSFTAQNLVTLTGYSGYDPDVASTNGARSNENDGFFGFRPTVNSITGRGIDVRAYPNAKSFLFGVDLTF